MAGGEAHKKPSVAASVLAQRSVRPGQAKTKRKATVSYKNQIRSVERLLSKFEVDPKLRARQEKKLEELRAAAAAHSREELERKYAVRYHKVKFFERVKLERRLRQLEQQLAAAGGAGEAATALTAQLEQARRDLQYVLHFPKGEKYVSVLKDPETEADAARVQAERARLRALVAADLARAALVGEADEGRSLAAALKHMQGAGAGRGAAPTPTELPAELAAAASGSEGEGDDFFLDEAVDPELSAPGRGVAAEPARRQPPALLGPLPKEKEKRRGRERVTLPARGAEASTRDGRGSGAKSPAVTRVPGPSPKMNEKQGKPALPSRPAALRLRIPAEHTAPAPQQRAAPKRPPVPVAVEPLRTRAEGGRKRRKKSA
ncbi:hypothetical protein ACKKBG_A13055 [Auxenochlorella protothecoides x Auxenochlorella symbiontica]